MTNELEVLKRDELPLRQTGSVSQTSTLIHEDDSVVVVDVRCTCSAGEQDEEATAGFEVVVPLAGAFVRRARSGVSQVDAAFGYVAWPDACHEIAHLSNGDRCVAVAPKDVLTDELGLDADSDSWVVPVDQGCQRRLSRALAVAAGGDRLTSGEAWLDVLSALRVVPALVQRNSRAGQRDVAVARVREAIAASPGAAWTVRSLGSVCGYAPHHLSRVFRASTGMTLSGYRDRVRLGRALALLRDGMPIADVASDLGYFDHAHLSRRARQVLGAAPSALRSMNRVQMSKPSR